LRPVLVVLAIIPGLVAAAGTLGSTRTRPAAAGRAAAGAALLGAIAGHDPNDSTSVDVPVPDYRQGLNGDLRGIRIGVADEYQIAGVSPGVTAAARKAIEDLEQLGAEIVPVSLPHTEHALATYYIIAPSEKRSVR
jgi:aspartyl-tRNA(Asn)/glutamyl-tRNA(Gln) amidotransferase subunit A